MSEKPAEQPPTLFGKPLSQEQIAGMARILGPAIDRYVAKKRAEEARPDQATSVT